MAGLYDGALNDLATNEENAARSAQPGSTLPPTAVPNPFEQGGPAPLPANDPAPEPATRGLYDAALDGVQKDDGARLQGALDIAQKSDPEKYAEASKIAARDGLPVDYVTANLDDLRSRATANDMRKVLEADPAVRRWFETGDNANAVKHDDLHRLSGMNWLMQSTSAAWSEGWGQRQQADIRFRQMMGTATPEEIRLADKMDKQGKRDYGSEGFFQGAPAALAAQLPNLIGSTAQGFERAAYGATLGTAAGATVGAAAGGVGAVPGAVLGFGAGTTAGLLTGRAEDNFKQEAGGAYGEFIRFRTDDGQAMDPAVARGAAVIAGVAAAGLETIGEAALERLVPGLDKVGVASLLRNGSREAIKEALQRPTVRAAFKAFGMNALKAGSTEIATEVAQEAVVLLGGELAKRADGGEFQTVEAGEVRSRLMDAATETAQAMLILTPALASPKFGADLRRARRSADMVSLYETANQTAKDTELRQRDPGRYLNAIKSFLGDGKASDTVYVDTQKLTELFQEQGLSPSDLDQRIDGFSARYAEAVATGSQVHIDMADYATHIAGTPLGEGLLEHQSWHPDNLTVSEANRALEEAKAQQEALLEDAIAAARDDMAKRAPAEQVAERVYAQLVNIGESPETARTQAALAKAFFGATAERSGLDALELYEQQRLEIRRAMPDGLDYRKTDELDLALDAVRRGDAERAGRARQRGRGQSLASFLAGKGGLVESDSFAGELNARDLKRFKSGRLIGKNGKGLNIDDASLAAAEAGYFPGYVDENGDIDRAGLVEAFLSSLDEEIAGRPVFTLDADAAQIDPQLARVEALAGELSALGLDTAAMSNEEIRAELMRATAQDAEQDALFQFAGERSVSRFQGRDPIPPRTWPRELDTFDIPAAPSAEQMQASGRVEDVPLSDVIPTENKRQWDRFNSGDHPDPIVKGYEDKPIAARLSNGTYYIYDGHHRTELALKRGDKSLSMHVIDVKDYAPGKDRKPSKETKFDASEIDALFGELFQTTGPSDLAGQRADKRGSIQFMQDRTVINLFKAANLSTFLHESGHLYLEVTKQVAERSSAPDQVKRDWQAVLDFIGAEQGKPITRDAHEKFAKAFETYLSEGRAPSEELRGVFERFKSWLLYVYRGASRAIGLPAIAPEIRDVFDRMLATDAELAEVGRAPEMRPLFADAAAAGMTQSQFDAYNRTIQAAADEARGSMLSRLLGEKRREQTREWRRQKEETRAEVFADLAARPVYQAQHYIRTGEILNSLEAAPTLDNRRLDRAWLVNKFGKDVLTRLPKQVPPIYTDKGGIHPDEMADWFGFDSGEQMVRELMSAPSFPRAVNARVDELMRERNGDLLSNQAEMAGLAVEAFNNDARGQYLEAELRALNGRANIRTGQASPRQQARALARQLIRGKRVAEAGRVGVFQRGAAKAAREAEAALAAGDFAAAADAKRRQLIQHAMAQESAAARDEADTIRRYLDRFSSRRRPAGVDPDYLDQIEGILEGIDLKASTSQAKIARRKGLAAWMAEQEAAGASFVVPKELIEDSALKSYKDMTMDDFAAVRDIVKNIEHLGRLKNRLLEKGRLKSFAEARDTLINQALRTPTRRQNKYRNPTKFERFSAGVMSVDAYLLKAEQIFQWLDMGDVNGPFTRIIFQRFVDAQTRKGTMMQAYAERVNTLLAGKPKEYLAERLAVPARPELSFTRAEIYSIALNQGTESNRNKLLAGETVENLAGRSFRDETEMNSALSLLSKEDWDTIQAVWDTLESLWPETAALERRITGVEPPKLERREVVTAHGTYKGGYYPMVYDPNESFDVEQRAAKDADALFDNKVYQRPAVAHGFTVARVENYSRPVKLDLGVLPAHLEASIHNITHREAVRDVLKLLSDKALANAIDQTMGRAVLRELNQWLGRIAADRGVTSNDAVTNFILRARANISLYSMGWRLTTALSQLAGFSNSLEMVKPYHMASALKESIRAPRETWEFVTSRSGEMRDRSNNLDRDVRLALRKLEDGDGPVQKFKRTAFFFTAMMDRVVTVPTWLGAYEQHLVTYPGDEAGAVRAGDRAVRLTQGAGAAKDLSGILGNQSALSVFTLFYSYFNLFYNRLRTLGRDTGTMMRDGSYEDLPHLIARSFALVILPAILADLIVGKWPSEEEDETWPWWAMKKAALYPLASVPLGRDIGSALDSGFDYQLSPLARPGDLTVKLIGDAGKAIQGDPVEGRLVAKRAAELSGYVLGLPLGQGVSTGSNIWQGLEQGDLKPKDLLFNRRAYGDDRKQ